MSIEWDKAAADYEATSEKATGYIVDRLVDWLEPEPGKRVTDVATGPGVVTLAMARRGAAVSASDFSPAMVARAIERASEEGLDDLVDVRVADGQDLPFEDKAFDGAVSNFGIIFCPDVDAALRELARVTRTDGRLAMTAWTVEARNGWPMLLAGGYRDELGFPLDPRPMFRWQSAEELGAACEAAGWSRVDIDRITFPPSVHASAEHVGEALETPATRVALSSLTPDQLEQLRAYLVERARISCGND